MPRFHLQIRTGCHGNGARGDACVRAQGGVGGRRAPNRRLPTGTAPGGGGSSQTEGRARGVLQSASKTGILLCQ